MAPAGTAGIGPMSGNWTAPNPPYGAVFTYSVKARAFGDATLVLTITDDTGRQVRRLDLDKASGLRRIAWNLRTDPPPGTPAAGGRGGGGGGGGSSAAAAAPGHAGGAGHLPRDARPEGGEEVTPVGHRRRFGFSKYRSRSKLISRMRRATGSALFDCGPGPHPRPAAWGHTHALISGSLRIRAGDQSCQPLGLDASQARRFAKRLRDLQRSGCPTD